MAARVFFSRMLCRRCRFHAIAGTVLQAPESYSVLHHSCHFSSISSSPEPTYETTSDRRDWRVVAAACVQRMPTLSREKSALEVKYEQTRAQVKMEKSKLSDFELEEKEFESMKKARIKKAQEESTDVKGLSDETDIFEDMLESREMELQEFEPAPRLTEADRIGDMMSLDRQLDGVLYLLVKKQREEHAWQMPQGGVEGEESLVEAAKRELGEECGSSVKVDFYSHAPLAVLSYKHPPSPHDQHSSSGSKVFFLKAFYQSGTLQLDKEELVNYMWVTKKEMKDYVSQEYYQAVEPILTD